MGRAARWLGAALTLLVWSAVGSDPAHADDDVASSVDRIVASLREDPVLVQMVVGGGDTAAVTSRLRDLADQIDVPVHVALVKEPPGLAEDDAVGDLATKLHSRLGEPGIYVVGTPTTPTTVKTWSVPFEPYELSLATTDAVEAARAGESDPQSITPAGSAEIALSVAAGGEPFSLSVPEVDDILAEPTSLVPEYQDYVSPTAGSTIGLPAMAVTLASLLTVALVLRAFVWGREVRARARRAKKHLLAPTADGLRDLVRQELEELSGEVAGSPASAGVDVALDCRSVAEHLLESEEAADLMGALVLVRSGRYAVETDRDRGVPFVYHCCFFHPQHGRGAQEASWRRVGIEVVVPACSACRRAVEAGTFPETLALEGRRGLRPYYERDDVWARTGYGALVDDLWLQVLDARAERP